MSTWKSIPLMFILCAVDAGAQERPAQESKLIAANETLCLVCKTYEIQYRPSKPVILLSESSFTNSRDRLTQPTSGDLDLHALEKLHHRFHNWFQTAHNPRLYSLTARALTNLYSGQSYLFNDWYRPRKGIDLFHLLGGRFAIGFETQRVLVFEGDRGSRPFRDATLCGNAAFLGMGPCGSAPFHAGERRYGVTFRWRLK